MARKRNKKKKLSTVHKIVIVSGVLIAAQIAFFLSQQSKESVTIREAINKEVSKNPNLDQRRREQLRIQLAMADFRASNQGQLPQSLNDLVPTYFDAVPVDPETNAPFALNIVDGEPYVGDPDARPSKPTTNMGGGQNAPQSEGPLTTEEEQAALIAWLNNPEEKKPTVYDPAGKRDPFRPFNLAPPKEDLTGKTPLERFAIGQLRLTAVLDGFEEPRAIVENAVGRGFTVKKGVKIGTKGGEIIEILPDKLLILERSVDFAGEEKTTTIEMRLRTKDQDE